jgi:tetratricopeptide (TPR) repeat protein
MGWWLAFSGFGVLAAGAEGNARQLFARGVLAECRGDEAGAAVAFEEALKLDPQALALVRRVVSVSLEEGDRAGAVRLMRELAEARSGELAVQLEYCDFLEDVGRGDALAVRQAIAVLELALEKHPGHPRVIERLFAQLRADGKEDEALELLERLDEADGESAMIYGSLAASGLESDDEEGMGRIGKRYEAAFGVEPRNVRLARSASEFLRKRGREDEAISILERHVEVAPWSLELRTRLGILYLSAKREEEGRKVLEEVLKISPRRILAHQSLAKLHRMRGRAGEARHHAGELLKIRGGSEEDYLKLADEYLAAGEVREARILLEKAAFEHGDSPAVLMKLAVATRRDLETRAVAGRRFREAGVVISGDAKPDAAFLLESAEVMLEEGQSKAAEESLRAAIRSYPPEAKVETAAALRRLARLWEEENRNAEAARALRQRADALDPEN